MSNIFAVYHESITNESFKWIIQTVPYLPIDFHSSYLIEFLNRLKNRGDDKIKTADYICDIYISMLKYFSPDFDKEHIYETIEYMYGLNDKAIKEKVDIICNKYGESGITDEKRKGQLFLRDLYEKYNQ